MRLAIPRGAGRTVVNALIGVELGMIACAPMSPRDTAESLRIPVYHVDSVITDSSGRALAAVAGTVADFASGRPLGGAQVLLTSTADTNRLFTNSDDRGGFLITRIPPGSYTVLVRKVGYYPYTQVHALRKSIVDTLRLALREAPGLQ